MGYDGEAAVKAVRQMVGDARLCGMAVGNSIIGRYDSVADFVWVMQASGERWPHWRKYSASSWTQTAGQLKAGETSAADVIFRYCRDGWAEGASLVQEVGVGIVPPAPTSIRRRATNADAGDEVDMQRVWNGDLDHAWRRTSRRQSSAQRRVRIVVDCIQSCGIDPDGMARRGAAAIKLADVLTEAGYSVQLSVAFHGPAERSFKLGVVVKPYEAPVDITTLCAAGAHPAFFRILGHGWGELHGSKRHGYGVPHLTIDDVDEIFGVDEGARPSSPRRMFSRPKRATSGSPRPSSALTPPSRNDQQHQPTR